MQTPLYLSIALFMGLIMSIYMPMNSSVSRYLGSPITACVTFFIIALITSILILFLFGEPKTITRIKEVPPYLYLTGVISAFFVLGTTFLIPHIGARRFFILLVAGQIIMAMIVSHYGVLESPHDPINIKKIVGAVLVIAGAMVSTS